MAEKTKKIPRPYIAGNPVRDVITRNAMNPVGLHQSIKMGGSIAYEGGIERAFLIVAEGMSQITYIAAQPETIRYQTPDGVAKATPDFAITQNGEQVIIECKSDEDAVRPKLVETFDLIRAAYARRGIRYQVVSKSEIHAGHRLAVCEFMWRYARNQLPRDDPIIAQARTMASCLENGSLTAGDLLGNYPSRLEGLQALAQGFFRGFFYLGFDRPFSDQTIVSPVSLSSTEF